MNRKKNPITNVNAVVNRGRPAQMVAIQQKIWNRDRRARRREKALAELRQRRREHVVHPKAETEKGRAHH
jgi:hypothetical protein